MTRSSAINLAAVALKAAHLPPDANACAVLALALLAVPDDIDAAPVIEKHLEHAVADLRLTFPAAPSALGAALLAGPGITAELAPKPTPKTRTKPATI